MEIVAYIMISISLISATVANIILDKKIKDIKSKFGVREAMGLIYIAIIIVPASLVILFLISF